jgi:hypothetical protein
MNWADVVFAFDPVAIAARARLAEKVRLARIADEERHRVSGSKSTTKR